MTTKILILATILCGSAVAYAAAPNPDLKPVKIDKGKDKAKDTAAVSVPDGDPSTALLLTLGAGAAIVCARALVRRGTEPR